jgi:crotonobetainyl-CoA:carnitine CoA-transferase CaiB-like acyl-CoA transferase
MAGEGRGPSAPGAALPGAGRGSARPPHVLPAAGLRVLDLTRVIAGPVATRFLAALGADVLRVDPPHLPELPGHIHEGLLGKRSALLDASTAAGLQRLHELLAGADVLVHGYRPGALDRFGLDGESLAARHPGLVIVSLSAWGTSGPWGDRRGFDSIVQAATGIALIESPDGTTPGALPCQLLDHATGYLAAAAALEGVRRQKKHGGTHAFGLSLATTAAWLLAQPRTAPTVAAPPAATAFLVDLGSATGAIAAIAPPGTIGGRPLRWPNQITSYGADEPDW